MAALGPADNPVSKTIELIITIHGVFTNSNSKESKTDLIPNVIASNIASPFMTAKSKALSTPAIDFNLISG